MAEEWLRTGERVAFLGDSLTEGGWNKPDGWVRRVAARLAADGVAIDVVPAGVGGHRSVDMAARLQRDVLDHHVDAVLVSCGVNDVWHGEDGVPLEAFRDSVRDIVARIEASGARVAILTATIIGEDLENASNRQLAAYNEVLRDLGSQPGRLLIDAGRAFRAAVRSCPGTGDQLTDDGVHFNDAGEALMAATVFAALTDEAARGTSLSTTFTEEPR